MLNNGMRKILVAVYPSEGDTFYLRICVKSTLKEEELANLIMDWLLNNLTSSESFSIVDEDESVLDKLTHLCFTKDCTGNAYEAYISAFADNRKLTTWLCDVFKQPIAFMTK